MLDDERNFIYGIGVGPGDPELITIKACNILRRADVIVYPCAVGTPSLVKSIALPYFPDDCIEISLDIPMSSDIYTRRSFYRPCADLILRHYTSGKRVVILCEGDPMFYGSFYYLYEILAKKCKLRIIPGVSSIHAASALTGHSLALQFEKLTIIPAPLPQEEIIASLRHCDNAVIIKLSRHLPKLRQIIKKLNIQDRALFVQYIGLAEQKYCPLADYESETAPYFSLLLLQGVNIDKVKSNKVRGNNAGE